MREKKEPDRISTKMFSAALEHTKRRGGLTGFQASRSEREIFMKTAIRQGLISWNVLEGNYVLTAAGQKRLIVYQKAFA